MVRPARLPEELAALQEVALHAARWAALEDWEPWSWVSPEPPAGTLVFELEGVVVGWCTPGGAPVVAPHAQGAGVEEALAEAAGC
jgi:hypothetical protein